MGTPQPTETLQTTPLCGWHESQGANMAPFGGTLMPLWYPSGAKAEHLSVLTCAGIFDTSHMAVLRVEGSDARELLQRCFSADLNARRMSPGRCVYGIFPDPAGGVLDDAIVYQLGPARYLAVVNAGMGPAVAEHLCDHAGDRSVCITDLSGHVGKMDIQGPMSARILARVLQNPDRIFSDMPYFSFKGDFASPESALQPVAAVDGTSVLISRTGYTGEFGFEVFTPPEAVMGLWRHIVAAGSSLGITACGLAARDSLRAGAMLPLSHQDVGDWPFRSNPWLFALPWNRSRDGFTKPFVGDRALLAAGGEHTHAFAGYDLRKVDGRGAARVMDADGRQIGCVLTCVTDMGVTRCGDRLVSVASREKPPDFKSRGICCGFVRVDRPLAPGTVLTLADHRRKITVAVVEDIRPDRTARRPISDFYPG